MKFWDIDSRRGDKDFKLTKFISKVVAEYNINKDTLDMFYGTISEVELYIKVLKG